MAHYVILGNFTEQGIENVKDAPKRREDFRKAVEAAHGKLLLHLYTMGPTISSVSSSFPPMRP